MQFQRVGNKIRVVGYVGYDREKKRSVTKMIASLDAHQDRLSDYQKMGLTEDQANEIDAHLHAVAARRNDELVRQRALALAADIAAAAEYYQSHQGELIERWDGIEAGIKKLRSIARKAKKTAK